MKKLLLTSVISLSAVFAVSAQKKPAGGRLSLVVETVSHHFTKDQYNNCNTGLGAEYRLSRHFHAGAGVYRNSIENPSVYMLAGYETTPDKFFGAGVEMGLVSGYQADVPFVPAGLLYARIGPRNGVNAKIDLIPPVKNITPAVVTLQIRVPVSTIRKYAKSFGR